MKSLVNHWHEVSVFLAGAVAVCAILLVEDPVQKCLLAAIVAMLLHFFEEFGFPGGFPHMGVKALLGSDEPDSTKWHCNNLNSMFGNWTALLLLYIVPLLLPGVRFLTLSAMMFLFAEVLMHLVLFNMRQKSLYNPGMVTGVVLMGAIGIYYFTSVFDASAVVWWDWALAVVWFVAVFVLCFRSPLYWKLGDKPGFPLTQQTAFGLAARSVDGEAGRASNIAFAESRE
ncbi:hypothetical protein Shel_18620 [Slackia heliotrinireducens DSM 20476]|uniref:HXXEE domain-containing protein n=1 Tax=Slackia heliotrinireducens (strain ATCC 29202 / DSM 20476 / NCTC 11029 / RHS 1) TaxID=471855 RepID=C7N7J3_SLAHD|nr:hypothetical protein Shel_18620 [Slackia heliotrinireducens DSM 20476]